jgi:hypothetical protein
MMKHSSLAHRIEENKRNSELFSKILEGYLELPHKLKPIFDRQKKYEQLFNKMCKADTQLLFEITSQVYDMNRGELQALEVFILGFGFGVNERRNRAVAIEVPRTGEYY